jgi:hypothetical protein
MTDAVTQSDVKVLGDEPALSLGLVDQAVAASTGLTIPNEVTAQQQLNTDAQAATVQGVSLLYTVDTAADAVATSKVSMSDLPTALASLGKAISS